MGDAADAAAAAVLLERHGRTTVANKPALGLHATRTAVTSSQGLYLYANCFSALEDDGTRCKLNGGEPLKLRLARSKHPRAPHSSTQRASLLVAWASIVGARTPAIHNTPKPTIANVKEGRYALTSGKWAASSHQGLERRHFAWFSPIKLAF